MKPKMLVIQPEKIYNLLSDITRLRCLAQIYFADELCVCELTHALDSSQPKISRHLALLRKYNVVTGRRDGLWIYYRLHPNLPSWIREVIKLTIKSIAHLAPYKLDKRRLDTFCKPCERS